MEHIKDRIGNRPSRADNTGDGDSRPGTIPSSHRAAHPPPWMPRLDSASREPSATDQSLPSRRVTVLLIRFKMNEGYTPMITMKIMSGTSDTTSRRSMSCRCPR